MPEYNTGANHLADRLVTILQKGLRIVTWEAFGWLDSSKIGISDASKSNFHGIFKPE
jgi:hypothetical protein